MPELASAIEGYFSQLPSPASGSLTHGQLHTDNILARDTGEICVVDIGETIRMASPAQDLYMLLWSHDSWTTGEDMQGQRAALLRGYGGPDDSTVEELRYWEFRACVEGLGSQLDSADAESRQQLVDRVEQIIDGATFCRFGELARACGLLIREHGAYAGVREQDQHPGLTAPTAL